MLIVGQFGLATKQFAENIFLLAGFYALDWLLLVSRRLVSQNVLQKLVNVVVDFVGILRLRRAVHFPLFLRLVVAVGIVVVGIGRLIVGEIGRIGIAVHGRVVHLHGHHVFHGIHAVVAHALPPVLLD